MGGWNYVRGRRHISASLSAWNASISFFTAWVYGEVRTSLSACLFGVHLQLYSLGLWGGAHISVRWSVWSESTALQFGFMGR